MSKETAGVLRDARALIEDPRCWIKGQAWAFIDGLDCYCSLGALRTISAPDPPDPWRDWAHMALSAAAGAPHVAGWNDAPERTHAEVLAAFDQAIKNEETT